MKAAVLQDLGEPPVYADFDEPVAGEGQVVVEMAAAAIHHVDLARAFGAFYLGPPPLPWGRPGTGWMMMVVGAVLLLCSAALNDASVTVSGVLVLSSCWVRSGEPGTPFPSPAPDPASRRTALIADFTAR